MVDALETRACTFVWDPRGFVRATMRQSVEMSVQDADEALSATHQLTGGQRQPVLVDTRGLKYQTKEARERFVSEDAEKVSAAVALLVGSPVSRMIGNFFLRQSAHRCATQIFTDEDAAVAWLLRFKA